MPIKKIENELVIFNNHTIAYIIDYMSTGKKNELCLQYDGYHQVNEEAFVATKNNIFNFICTNTYTTAEFEAFLTKHFNKELLEEQTYKYLIRGRYGNKFYNSILEKI